MPKKKKVSLKRGTSAKKGTKSKSPAKNKSKSPSKSKSKTTDKKSPAKKKRGKGDDDDDDKKNFLPGQKHETPPDVIKYEISQIKILRMIHYMLSIQAYLNKNPKVKWQRSGA